MNLLLRQLLLPGLLLLLSAGPGLASGDDLAAPTATDRCPVCGMRVAPYAAWIASVTFEDGTRQFFDGPKDLFSYLFTLSRYPGGRTLEQVRTVRVTEYYTGRPLRAGDVFFVSGSDVLGPMGQELVPVAGREEARTFLSDHGGTRVLSFDGRQLQPVTLD